MAADPFADVAHDDPFAAVAQPAPAAKPIAHAATPFADPKRKPMFDMRGFENATDSAMDALGEAGKHVGSTALDLLGRPGQAGLAAAARGPRAAGDAFVHGGAPTQDRDLATVRAKVPGLAAIYDKPSKPDPVSQAIGHFGRGLIDAGLQAGLDPTTLLGGGGAIENVANKVGRGAYIATAKGLQKGPQVLRDAHDFVTPGGAAAGAAKRTLAAEQGGPGLDKYLVRKMDLKKTAPPLPEPRNTNPDIPLEVAQSRAPFTRPGSSRLPMLANVGPKPHISAADVAAAVQKGKDDAILAPMGKAGRPDVISQIGATPGGNLAKRATKGTTSLMFTSPQFPGMPGHGSNVLQTALLSDPSAALTGLGRFAAGGTMIPGTKLREAYQRLPGVRDIVKGSNDAIARAAAAGAEAETPERELPKFIEKIPGLKQSAEYAGRTLWDYDKITKGALNDAHAKAYGATSLPPKVAAARAADRVGQDIVDYGDKSDLTRALSFALPFATYATKKPGIIARAAARHPERVLSLTRNNPNFASDRDEPMTEPDQGRPMASIFNALNNRSPAAKGGAPFPGAQYLRASGGAPQNDLLGVLNSYFTYGPPAKHADGNAALGWLKLLATQAGGNVPGGDALLTKSGLNYFDR